VKWRLRNHEIEFTRNSRFLDTGLTVGRAKLAPETINRYLTMKSLIKNMILFKIGWTACVGSAAQGHPWIGAIVILLICGEHIWTAQRRSPEAFLLLAAGLLGLFWETLLVNLGLLEYGSGVLHEWIAPYWIVALWLLFATTLNSSLKWLSRRWELASLVGLICGPAAFFAGERMGAVNFNQNHVSLLAIGLGWAILLPILAGLVSLLNTPARTPASIIY
jgi:hypothetical protein